MEEVSAASQMAKGSGHVPRNGNGLLAGQGTGCLGHTVRTSRNGVWAFYAVRRVVQLQNTRIAKLYCWSPSLLGIKWPISMFSNLPWVINRKGL